MTTSLKNWMSWEGGVDLVACTQAGLAMPNVIVHLARIVHTPVGSAASGMIFFQPDPAAAPLVMGFVSHNPEVGRYFGPKVFAGTPFEQAPVLDARIEIDVSATHVAASVTAGGHVLRSRLEGLRELGLIQRAPGGMTPFHQQGLEAVASSARLWVDGNEISIIVPPVGISGGPAAVFAPTGIYAR